MAPTIEGSCPGSDDLLRLSSAEAKDAYDHHIEPALCSTASDLPRLTVLYWTTEAAINVGS